jgi:hypothetical protein
MVHKEGCRENAVVRTYRPRSGRLGINSQVDIYIGFQHIYSRRVRIERAIYATYRGQQLLLFSILAKQQDQRTGTPGVVQNSGVAFSGSSPISASNLVSPSLSHTMSALRVGVDTLAVGSYRDVS